MKTINELQNIIEKEIQSIKYPEYPKKLYEPIAYILDGGGKRIRPLLLLLSYNLFNDDISIAIKPAIGVEIFHNFTLMHDDIMDKSVLRRNKKTVHKKWNNNVAILSGDAMLIFSYKFFFDLPSHVQSVALNLFTDSALKVCEGQQLDMNFERKKNVSEDEYLKMIELKTAILIACSMGLGGIIAEANEKDINLLYQIGKNIGLAFQLQDDYLDVFGNEDTFGKKIGNDIINNKKTFLLILAKKLADKERFDKLEYWFSQKKNVDVNKKVAEVTTIYKELSVDKLVREEIQKYINISLNLLNKLSVDKYRFAELEKIIDAILKRNK
jgi:geranylgeranyl diphosphate synthase type II